MTAGNGAGDHSPLCFVLMPYGVKRDANGTLVDFNAIYDHVFRPAIEDADCRPIRSDEERTGGLIHKAMFERLMLCDYAVADLSTANANVFYELGIRHALRPYSTVLVYADGFRLPFDVAPLAALKYSLDAQGRLTQTHVDRGALAQRLRDAQARTTDSPLFQVFGQQLRPLDLGPFEVEAVTERARESARLRDIAAAATTTAEVDAVRTGLGDLRGADPGVVVQLLSTYQDLGQWERIVSLVEQASPEFANETYVLERQAMALNRLGGHAKAKLILQRLLNERGASSETLGLLGRVYKDEWENARDAGQTARATGALDNAIATYLEGFETDMRDPYPGVNAVELMAVRQTADQRWRDLLPIVRYSAERRLRAGGATYWDYATLLELAVMSGDESDANQMLARALATGPTAEQAATTLDSLRRLEGSTYAGRARPPWLPVVLAEVAKAARTDPTGTPPAPTDPASQR